MAVITSGTPGTRTQHTPSLSALGAMTAMGIPALLAIVGIITLGWDAIAWGGAILWGLVATFAFWLFMVMGKAMGMTKMDLLDMLGSMFTRPHTGTSRALGFGMHHINGVLLAIAGAYGAQLVDWSLNWASGLIWGFVLWTLALLLMTSVGGVHPAMRHGDEEDPGTAAVNFGRMTPLGSLMGHLVYGLVLGVLYQNWPLG